MLATESTTDPKVKKKLIAVLAAWHAQFKDDPSMSLVAGLYNQYKPAVPHARPAHPVSPPATEYDNENYERKRREERERRERKEEERRERKEDERREKEDEKRKAKEAKEADKARLKAEEEARRKKATQPKTKRKAFNFEEVRRAYSYEWQVCSHSWGCRRNRRF